MKKFYRITAYGASLYGAIDSAFVVFCAVYATFVQFAPWQVAALIACLAVGLIAMAIDYGLMQGLQTFFGRYYDQQQGTHKHLIMRWSLLFLCLQIAGTTGLTIYGRQYVTQAAVASPIMGKADMTEPNRLHEINQNLTGQLERLKAAERKELAAAVVNPQLATMAKEGNNWAATEVNKKRKRITDKYAAERLKIEQQIATNLSAQQAATATAGRVAVAQYEQQLGTYATATATLNTLQLWLSLASTGLLILSSLLYALEEVYQKGQAPSPDKEVYKGPRRSPFGFFRRSGGAVAVAPEAVPSARVSMNARAAVPSAAYVPPAPKPKPSPQIVFEGKDLVPDVPRAVAVATFGISDVRQPLDNPGWLSFVQRIEGRVQDCQYEIAAYKKALRTYWSALDKLNRGEGTGRNPQTVVYNIEKMEAVLHAAGVQSETRKRLATKKATEPA
jgi:hypothetical protein